MGAFEGSSALVTGGGSGIGRAAAELFAAAGAAVLVVDRNAAGAKETVERIAAAGGEASPLACDVTDESAVEAMVRTCASRYGRLDAAMNNAGISDRHHSWIGFPTEQWRRVIDVNLSSVFLCLKHELEQMAGQEPRADGVRGAIVNTASAAGLIPAPGLPHYTAAKHGVIGLTRSAAAEFGRRGVRVNTICPGLTETPMIDGTPEALKRRLASESPTGALGQPEDVARAAVWLCSADSHWVNGQALVADAGNVMH